MPLPWKPLLEVIEAHQRFLITSHVRPDCDALGSELGLAGLLRAMGKQVAILNADPVPASLAFIDPRNEIAVLDPDSPSIPDHDAFVVVDTSAWIQLGAMADVMRNSTATKIVIDHHRSSDDLGAELFKDDQCEATGRLITELAQQAQIPLTPEIATPLFAALITDTGWLRFPSVSDSSYRIAADLIAGGADPTWIYGQLYEQETLGRSRLRGMILARLQTRHDGQLVFTHVRQSDFVEAGALPNDTEDAVNRGLAIKGTQVAAIFVEQPQGGYKISLRSRCHVDCSQVAEQFGGGGHSAAAGAFIEGELQQVQDQVLGALGDALLNQSPQS